jgi:hypothetical protein
MEMILLSLILQFIRNLELFICHTISQSPPFRSQQFSSCPDFNIQLGPLNFTSIPTIKSLAQN